MAVPSHTRRIPDPAEEAGTTQEAPQPQRSDRDDLLPGTEIIQHKSFEVVERLGEGGMGKIYKAYDPSMDRYIALKVLKPDVPESEGMRFHREALIAANFSHPNLIRVLELGQSGSFRWMAMEYLRGRDLGELISRAKPISFRLLVDIFSNILDALSYIHQRGIIHCDIKPDNIFITRDQYDRKLVIVKLIDFGIARQLDGPPELRKYLAGDPRYMAPEQCILQGVVDPRTDLYSLGLAFYEAATLTHPFADSFHLSANEILNQQQTRELDPPSLLLPLHTPVDLARELDGFIARACAKKPEQRFANASEMLSVLNKLLEHLGQGD